MTCSNNDNNSPPPTTGSDGGAVEYSAQKFLRTMNMNYLDMSEDAPTRCMVR